VVCLVVTFTAYKQDDCSEAEDPHERKEIVHTEELRRITAGKVKILMQYGVTFPTALFPQLLVSEKPLRKLQYQVPSVLQILSYRGAVNNLRKSSAYG
jgi:hypothetical protein